MWFVFQAAIVAAFVYVAYGEVTEPRSAAFVFFAGCITAYALTVGITSLGDLWRRLTMKRLSAGDESASDSAVIPRPVPRDIFDLSDSIGAGQKKIGKSIDL